MKKSILHKLNWNIINCALGISIILILANVSFSQDEIQMAKQALLKGDGKGAIKVLAGKSILMTSAEANNLLGIAYSRNQNSSKDQKSASKAFSNAVKLDPNSAMFRSNYAYSLLTVGDRDKAEEEATKATELDSNFAEAFYTRGLIRLANMDFEKSLSDALRAVELEPNSASYNSFAADAYMYRYFELAIENLEKKETVPDEAKFDLLKKAVNILNGCNDECMKQTAGAEIRNKREIFAHFLEKRLRKANEPRSKDFHQDKIVDPLNREIKILSKPTPSYTNKARNEGIQGTVILLVCFNANGTIGTIVPLKTLRGGLTEKAINVSKKIKFEPETLNGKPITIFATLQYSFTIY